MTVEPLVYTWQIRSGAGGRAFDSDLCAWRLACTISRGDRSWRGPVAEVICRRGGSEVRVRFGSEHTAHALAMAHDLAAQCWQYVGDYADDHKAGRVEAGAAIDRVQVDGLDAFVLVCGHDAPIPVAGFFGLEEEML